MAKSLCKYHRVEIADQIAAITDIVSAPKYLCNSCARAASDKAYLCKPRAISLKSGQPSNASHAKSTAESTIESLMPEGQDTVDWSKLTKKQSRKLKKLAKKKINKFKQAAKALKRYNSALKKANIKS